MAIKSNSKFTEPLNQLMQGKAKKAISLIKKIKRSNLKQDELLFIKRINSRFVDKKKPVVRCSDPLVKKLLLEYQKYWYEVILENKNKGTSKKRLYKNIVDTCNEFGEKITCLNDEEIQTKVKKIVKKRGYHCIVGTVQPFEDFEVWKSEEVKEYKVKLVDCVQKVKVVMMSDFISNGWMHFTTAGIYYPGGWATEKALFCCKGSYNLSSDKYRINYLTHEAQHLRDIRKYKLDNSIKLEYRAKLAELSSPSRVTLSTFNFFKNNQAKNKSHPHAYANFMVYRDIIRLIKDEDLLVSKESINYAAKELLLEDTIKLSVRK